MYSLAGRSLAWRGAWRGCSTSNRRDDVSRRVILQLRARRPAAPTHRSRRVVARSDLEFVLGSATTAALGAAAVVLFVSSDGAMSVPAATLSVRTLLEGDARTILGSLLTHSDAGHFGVNLMLLGAAGLSVASAPTFLYRWVAIPAVFAIAGATSAAVQLAPDITAACEALPGGTAALRRSARAACAELVHTWDVVAFTRKTASLCGDAAAGLRNRPWVVDHQPTRVFGAAGGSLGLVAFAALEWAAGGAGLWPALLVPILLSASGAGALLAPPREPAQRSALAVVTSPAFAASVARWGRHLPPPPFMDLTSEDVRVGGGVGDAAGIAAGVFCWLAGRGVRGGVAMLRVISRAAARSLRRVLPVGAGGTAEAQPQRFTLR